MGIGVGAYISQMGGTSYLEFLAPGLVAVAAMNGASFEVTYNAFVRLNFEKTYESMLTTPIQPDDVLAGEILWAVTRPPRVNVGEIVLWPTRQASTTLFDRRPES